jgi:TolB-like protein/Tfp pilus assembly protein PilF
MASLIPGYEYDIFISYRQKDNKGDRWVSEFVDALKTELESTFKEEINVYFDINLHDGLLETHDVDASLKEKLKCLIFIPIISRTYCDPKSFAWEHEFKAFVDLASQDQFGLKVRLPNGNVASRVLPIRIHDLDNTDIKLCESVLGGVLRSIDFIYKSVGVNRPLRANEDHPQDNLNKTYYRDQINKVANSIREIITALGQHIPQKEEVSKEVIKPVSIPLKNNKVKIIISSLIILALIVLGYFFIPKHSNSSIPVEKSIAVLPFTNLSNDPEQEYFSDGIVEAILDHLFKIGELKVTSGTSTKKYKKTELSVKEIGRELSVSSILEGSVQKIGNNVRITAQLIDARTDVHLWSETYDRNISDIFSIQSEVAQTVARELKATLTLKEKGQIEKNQTNNVEAYNLYLQGRFFWDTRTKDGLNRSIEYFEKAIATDPDYALAYAGLADSYFIQAYWGWIPWNEGVAKSKKAVLQALDIDKNLAEAHTVLGALLNYKEWKWEDAWKELQHAINLNPNFVTAHHYYSELLDILRQNYEARKQINIALQLDPFLPVLRAMSSDYFYDEGKLKESLDECFVLQKLDPEYHKRYCYLLEFRIYCKQKEDLKALEALQNFLYMDTLKVTNSNVVKDVYDRSGLNGLLNWLIELELKKSNPNLVRLASIYAIIGKKEEALDLLEKAFENPPPGFANINNDPDLDNLRSEPRFQAIIKKMGLSEYATKE